MKKYLRIAILFLITEFAISAPLQAQYLDGMLGANCSTMAMGGASTGYVSSSHMLFSNASLVSFSSHAFQISTSFYGLDDGSYNSVSGYARLGGGALQAGWRRLSLSGTKENCYDLAYSRRIGGVFSISTGAKYIHTEYSTDDTSSALAFDLGAAARLPLWTNGTNITIGATLKNLGWYLKGDGDLPLNLNFGAALRVPFKERHAVTLAADYGYLFNPESCRGSQISFGAEYSYLDMLFLRGGYHIGDDKKYIPSYASVGAGIKFLFFNVEFAYVFTDEDTYLKDPYMINVGLNF